MHRDIRNAARSATAGAFLLLFVSSVHAVTFVVPHDRQLVQQAGAIVVVSPLSSHTELRNDVVETVTTMGVDNVLKGRLEGNTIDVWEPGGAVGNRATIIPGVPRFRSGSRYVLFLVRTEQGLWRVLDLGLGNFRFDTDSLGREVLVRESNDIAGWDPDGAPHREQTRAADAFIEFIRTTVVGGPADEHYVVASAPTVSDAIRANANRVAQPLVSATGFTATTYTYVWGGNGEGARWNVFPSPVYFYSTNANSAAVTAMNNAIAAWDNDPGSNVNYVNAGADTSGAHNGGVTTPDHQNTVAFERNLVSEYGATAFSCGPSSYGGTLGVGGVTNASGSHVGPDGQTFVTTSEGDVEMNQGLSTCTFFINLGDFNSAVAHELGHTLGFRHADQERTSLNAPPCAGDATLECSSSAIMKAYIPSGLHGALQAWDQHAVDAVYPSTAGSCPTAISTAPNACLGSSANTATIPAVSGSTYTWSVTNGTITGGQGTTSITFAPTTAGTVTLNVAISNCSTLTKTVNADVCAGSGDVNGDGTVNTSDIFYLINDLFTNGPAPAGGSGDVNGDGVVNTSDIFYLINYLFANGPAPK